jgi:hypothetical protein
MPTYGKQYFTVDSAASTIVKWSNVSYEYLSEFETKEGIQRALVGSIYFLTNIQRSKSHAVVSLNGLP